MSIVELVFSDEDHQMYGKLDAACLDLAMALQYGRFILKKGWKAKPWSRGTVYLQQSAFVTAMVTSYCRAFTKSRGWPKLPTEFLDIFDETESRVHQKIITLRHEIYAHSDSSRYGFIPLQAEFLTDIQTQPFFEVDHAEIEHLLTMCQKMLDAFRGRKVQIKARYLVT